jgi:hypothetical protein
MYKYCDFTELLAYNLNDKALVKEIVKRGKVNWFKTFCGGLTFFDLVYERTDDPEIIALVHSMLPMDPHLLPYLYEMDSMKRTASVNGSAARDRRSLSLLTHSEETAYEHPCLRQTSSTYPIYESLYPAIPSAPPIDLM